jgi:hypothetical protein
MSKQILDNLKTNGARQGAIDFFGQVLRDLQLKHGTNVSASLNVLNEFNQIVHADNIKTLGIDTLTSTQYVANSLIDAPGTFVNTLDIENTTGVIPNDINPHRGMFVKSHDVIIGEAEFNSTNAKNSANTLTTGVTSLLNNNSTYSNAGVTTALEYAVKNGYVDAYNSLDSTSFAVPAGSREVQDSIQYNNARLKTKFASLLKG